MWLKQREGEGVVRGEPAEVAGGCMKILFSSKGPVKPQEKFCMSKRPSYFESALLWKDYSDCFVEKVGISQE